MPQAALLIARIGPPRPARKAQNQMLHLQPIDQPAADAPILAALARNRVFIERIDTSDEEAEAALSDTERLLRQMAATPARETSWRAPCAQRTRCKMISIKPVATAIAVAFSIASIAAHAAPFEPPLSGYSAPCTETAYPSGFADAGVTITGTDLTGIGLCHGLPERLVAADSMTLSFAPTSGISFYLWPPGPWLLVTALGKPSVVDAFGAGPFLFGLFTEPGTFDFLTLKAPTVTLLTTPPLGIPEPWSVALLGAALLGLGCVGQRKRWP